MADTARDARGDRDEAHVSPSMRAAADELKDAAWEQGRTMFDGARRQAASYADDRKNEAAESVSGLAASLRETGQSFGERPNLRSFVDGAADGLEQLADGLRERSFTELYGEAEAYARRSPLVVGAVAAAAGFLLARFIKSSADDLSEAAARADDEARAPRPSREG